MATPAPQPQSGGGTVSVQHVAKAFSDELLCKFIDSDAAHCSTLPCRSLALRRKRSSRRVASGLSARDSEAGAAGIELAAPKRMRSTAEWKARLLLPTTTASACAVSHPRRCGVARLDPSLLLAALEYQVGWAPGHAMAHPAYPVGPPLAIGIQEFAF